MGDQERPGTGSVSVPSAIVNFIDAYNAMDVAAMMACLTDTAVFENISNNHASMVWEGKDAIRKLAEQSAAAFASRKQEVLRCLQDGDTVALEVEFTGIPVVDLPNGMKAGEASTLQGVSFMEIKDGLICRLRDYN